MAVVSAFASVTVNVNVGGVCTVNYYANQESKQVTLVEGDNVIEDATYLNFGLTDSNYIFTSCKQGDVAITSNWAAKYGYLSSLVDGATYYVTVSTLADACDAKCTIKVDDPSKVSIYTNNTSRRLSLEEGENVVSFISSLESPLQISHANYGSSLYEISVNGTKQTVSQYGNYVSVADGDVVEVKANYPDVKNKVTFVYGEGAEGFITGVSVDNVAITDFENGFEAQCGSIISITGNTSDYKYESMTIGGSAVQSFYGSTSFTLTEDTEVVVNAHKYGTLSFTVNVDDPANFTLYKGYSYQNNPYTLVEGANELEISENSTNIQFKANSGCYFTSIKANDEEKYYSSSSVTNITVTEGMVITVTTGKIVRDKTVTINIDDKSLATYNFSLTRADRSSIDVVNGENKIEFCDADLPIYFAAYGQTYLKVTLNSTECSPVYAGGSSYQFDTLNDGDVININFIEEESSGVENIAADANATFDVYNLQGVRVARNVSNLNNLPAGIYIANGKKVVVK